MAHLKALRLQWIRKSPARGRGWNEWLWEQLSARDDLMARCGSPAPLQLLEVNLSTAKTLASALALACMAVAANAQELPSPAGVWEISTQDSRYQIEMCGDDGESLCGTLIWLGGGARNEDNLPYLNTTIIDAAPPTGENVWRGTLHLWGHTGSGNITQVDADRIELEGCAFIVVCRTYTLHRYEQAHPAEG